LDGPGIRAYSRRVRLKRSLNDLESDLVGRFLFLIDEDPGFVIPFGPGVFAAR
jgi:hypothetical protein